MRLRRFGSTRLPVPPVGPATFVVPVPPPCPCPPPGPPPPPPPPPPLPPPLPGGLMPTPNGVLAAEPELSPDPAPSDRPWASGIAYSLPAGVLGSNVTPGSGAAACADSGSTSANAVGARKNQRRMLLGIAANSRLRASGETPIEPDPSSILTFAWLAPPV